VNDPRNGHIDDFLALERDLDALVEHVLEPFCRPAPVVRAWPFRGRGNRFRSPFARMVLTAPMIEVYGQRFGRGMRICSGRAAVSCPAATLYLGELRGQS
jgi:hypothetical protein